MSLFNLLASTLFIVKMVVPYMVDILRYKELYLCSYIFLRATAKPLRPHQTDHETRSLSARSHGCTAIRQSSTFYMYPISVPYHRFQGCCGALQGAAKQNSDGYIRSHFKRLLKVSQAEPPSPSPSHFTRRHDHRKAASSRRPNSNGLTTIV